MKIAVIGHLKHPVAPPFAGGLESFTHRYVTELVRRGHDVTLFASGDSDSELPLEAVVPQATVPATERLREYERWPTVESLEDRAYTRLCQRLVTADFDVIHNNTLSPVLLQWADRIAAPFFTTLHVPPLPRMVDAIRRSGRDGCGQFINISISNMRRWTDLIGVQRVIYNGIEDELWQGDVCDEVHRRAIWFGRILPDKGTHYAVEAAHAAGLPIDLVGPVADARYFRKRVMPLLSGEDRYHGHLDHMRLRELVCRSAVALVTPCWDEPFGLVVVEALACGTPVAGFARGALPEIVGPEVGSLAPPDCVDSLANSVMNCLELERRHCREAVRERFTLSGMIDRYEALFEMAVLAAAA